MIGRRAPARLRASLAPTLLQWQALCRGRLIDRRWWRDPGAEAFWLETPEGRIAATWRVPGAAGRSPALLLIHGSHPAGQGLGVYRLLGARLAQQGIAVLSVDLPGFGHSPPPTPPWRAEQFTGHSIVRAAVAWLTAHPRVEQRRISLFGHSFGGSVATAAALTQPGLHTVIALGPTRRVEARALGPEAKEAAWLQARFALARRLRPWPAPELVRQVSRAVALEYHLDWWSRPGHVPLLLMDGEYESLADRRFLAELARRIAAPVWYRTVPCADHYLNTANCGGGVSYDRRAVDTCVRWILEWLHASHDVQTASRPAARSADAS